MRITFLRRAFTLVGLCLLLCCFPACTFLKPEVIKIGLVAPFEGDKRYLGYDAIYAARLAIREINAAGGINGIPVELVAYDDRASADMATDAVRNLAIDPQVVAVVGHYYDVPQSLPLDVMSLYDRYELPLLSINGVVSAPGYRNSHVFHMTTVYEEIMRASSSLDNQDELAKYWELGAIVSNSDKSSQNGVCTITPYPIPQDVPGTEAWIEDYQAVGPHVPAPGMMALVTYDVIKALAQTLAEHSAYDREAALAAIMELDYGGYLGHIKWTGKTQTWGDAPLYYYCWHDGQLTLQRQFTVGE